VTGKILAYNALLEYLYNENLKIDDKLKDVIKIYNDTLENYKNIANKVFKENEININDFKTIFNSAYNSSYKIISETFKDDSKIFYNEGFFLDKEKETIYFKIMNELEIPYKYYREAEKEIVFFFEDNIELNCIKAIIKDSNGINITPKEIIIENTLGNSYFLEDFNRFFEFKENEYDTQTFISNPKKTNIVKFRFDEMPNIPLSTFKFLLLSYETNNEIIIKYNNIFKKNKLIKIKRSLYDKYKALRYLISFDGIDFTEFNWSNPELDKLDIEDDIKLINLPEKVPENIFIKLLADKPIDIDNKNVVKTDNFIEQIVPKNYLYESKDKYIYPLNNQGGNIVKNSIKIYLSNKYANLLINNKSELIDKISEKGKNRIADGFINVENTRLERDDEFFLLDFDSLDSLKNIENQLGFYIDEKLYLPSLFYEENIYFRVSYDVEFVEDSNNASYYTPFIFDMDIIGGD
jgi:hypothetical protein